MDNITKLWIRACKSLDPETRVNSVYRRFYCAEDGRNRDIAIAMILSQIVDEVSAIPCGDMISMLHPDHYLYGRSCHFKQSRAVMESRLRMTNAKKIKGWTTPAKFRSKL